MVSARRMDDIIRHLGGIPRCHTVRTIYSSDAPTWEDAEELSESPDFENIANHVNLV